MFRTNSPLLISLSFVILNLAVAFLCRWSKEFFGRDDYNQLLGFGLGVFVISFLYVVMNTRGMGHRTFSTCFAILVPSIAIVIYMTEGFLNPFNYLAQLMTRL